MQSKKRIAILGGGPSGLFMFKRLVDTNNTDLLIEIFEKKQQLGAGMPYSTEGAGYEHITNVSGNEIPSLVTPIAEWIKTVPESTLSKFNINPKKFNDYKVLPRLLFGQYLSAQFDLLQQQAKQAGIFFKVNYNSAVTDIIDYRDAECVIVTIAEQDQFEFDHVIICTGHNWPMKHEGIIPGYFDSPYPPAKLALKLTQPVAIKGSSLTAVDAVRTLARHNGNFERDTNGDLFYTISEQSSGFRIILHSRNGMLPAVRFHLEDTHLVNDSLLTPEEIAAHIKNNNGFLSLDFVFEKNFKEIFRTKEPEFYECVRDMSVEDFVASMMELRERLDPFVLLKAEYIQAEKSIKRQESIYWKEMLGVLSFAMNYPAKHLSAEDMQRLQKILLPLISIVIAYMPQSSCEEFLALHQAGVLDIVSVGEYSNVEPEQKGGATYYYEDENNHKRAVYFNTYVDCVGQPHLSYKKFPFKSMLAKKTISPARLRFKSAENAETAITKGNTEVEHDNTGEYYLKVPGITINDNFQVIDPYGAYNNRISIMAVPYIGGYNPDYSGLDFCEAASAKILQNIIDDYSGLQPD